MTGHDALRALLVSLLSDPEVREAIRAAAAPADDPWMSLTDAAVIAGVQVRALRDAARRGDVEIGRGVIRPSQLDRYLSARPRKVANDEHEDVRAEARAAVAAAARKAAR